MKKILILIILFSFITIAFGEYGDIDVVIDSEEWDEVTGIVENPDAFVRIGDTNYFLTSAKGESSDGFLTVIEVNDTGVFNDSVISEWEYDITSGVCAGILHIYGDIYLVYYQDDSNGQLFTTRVWENGTLQKTKIDYENYTRPNGQTVIHITGDIYALTYQQRDADYDHFLETYNITSAGSISSRIDVVEYDETTASTATLDKAPHICLIDSDTVAVIMSNNTYDSRIYTYNISSLGDITNTPADFWEVESNRSTHSHIKNIGDSIAIAYSGVDSDGFIKTINISDSGFITKSFIDTLEFDTGNCTFPIIFTVNEGSVYGVTYKGTDSDGFVCTFNMSTDGTIGNSIIDVLEFETVYNYYHAPILNIADNYYVICYSGDGTVGWAVSVNIETEGEEPPNNNPTVEASFPLDGATGISVNVSRHNVTLNDPDGDLMNYEYMYFIEGCCLTGSNGFSVGNGTYSLILNAEACCPLEYGATYTWWFNVTDLEGGYENKTFSFTTETLPYVPLTTDAIYSFMSVLILLVAVLSIMYIILEKIKML